MFKAYCVLSMLALMATASADEDAPNPKLVPPAPLHEQVLHLAGDPDRPVSLVVTLYTPDGPGPFPLAVMNHGASGSREKPAAAPRYRFTMSAYYFLSRGYAVALPMMRGFAGSGGMQNSYGCDLAQVATDNGRDIEGVIASLHDMPGIDTSRVVVAGQSFGGWNTLGLGADIPGRNIRGLVDFVGGVQSSACDEFHGGRNALIEAAGKLGASTLLPSIWFYGENDSLFGPDVWQPMHDAYVSNGAKAELVDIGRFMDDSHQMLSRPESIPLWTPRLDAFLTRIGLPGREVFPQYMPLPWPAPTHFAAIGDAAAIPWINDEGRANYGKFLNMKPPRVFVIAPGGQSATAQGGFDPRARAEGLCRSRGFICFPYAIDNDVVFVPPPGVAGGSVARPRATNFAAVGDVAALPWVNEKGRDAYRSFLAHPPPRAFVIGTGGETIGVTQGADPLTHAMTICANYKLDCRPYAVDEDVVWVPPPAPRTPVATKFAAIGDVAAVPWVNARSRALYEHFLTVDLPRAFVVAKTGQAAATQGGYDPLGRALRKCLEAGFTCRPYAVDDKVVWGGPRGE
jgi:dienelactone hydrolase